MGFMPGCRLMMAVEPGRAPATAASLGAAIVYSWLLQCAESRIARGWPPHSGGGPVCFMIGTDGGGGRPRPDFAEGDAMKNLLIVRHAKSSWDEPVLSDRERRLNARGKRDAPVMGALLRSRGLKPDLIVSSPAVRARKTAKLLAKAVAYPAEKIRVEEAIYLHGIAEMMELIHSFEDRAERIYLVGHNPDLTDLVNHLSEAGISNLPTCGIASIVFAVDSWAHIAPGAGRLVFFDYPKKYRDAPGGDPVF